MKNQIINKLIKCEIENIAYRTLNLESFSLLSTNLLKFHKQSKDFKNLQGHQFSPSLTSERFKQNEIVQVDYSSKIQKATFQSHQIRRKAQDLKLLKKNLASFYELRSQLSQELVLSVFHSPMLAITHLAYQNLQVSQLLEVIRPLKSILQASSH